MHCLLGPKTKFTILKLRLKFGKAMTTALIVCKQCPGKVITVFRPMIAFKYGMRSHSMNPALGYGTIRTYIAGLSATVSVTSRLRIVFVNVQSVLFIGGKADKLRSASALAIAFPGGYLSRFC
jgi:hypothetical protein